jgi:hypothetical protein
VSYPIKLPECKQSPALPKSDLADLIFASWSRTLTHPQPQRGLAYDVPPQWRLTCLNDVFAQVWS